MFEDVGLRKREDDISIVAIGGGTGLSTLLRGLKGFTKRISAVVAVTDDGGSSGAIRRELGILPPGDFRQCLLALADAEPLMRALFSYRFESMKEEGSTLNGHSLGNLFIAALTDITGSFEEAVAEASRILAVRGKVMPSSTSDVSLCAEFSDGTVVCGESTIPKVGKPIRRVFLKPEDAPPYPDYIEAVERADVCVIGPGSLYTSVIPNLIIRGASDAIRRSKALKIYVCNVASQPGETDGYGVEDHVRAILSHSGEPFIDIILANTRKVELPKGWKISQVLPDSDKVLGIDVVGDDLIDVSRPTRHDPIKLAGKVLEIARARKG